MFLDILFEAAAKQGLAIHAYVLMTNHIHLLTTPESATSLPKTMQSLGRKYVQYFNFAYRRTGTLWEGRYRATIIEAEAYLLTCMRYIELNPVRAAMAAHPRDYPWSSYGCHAEGKPQKTLREHIVYRRLGKTPDERQAAYRQLFRAQLPKAEVDAIRVATNKAWVLGNDRFREKIETISGRRAMPLLRGRPRKIESDPIYTHLH